MIKKNLKKVDELNLVLLFFWGFLDQRGPSIQSDFDKRVAIFDPKNILDKRPRINVWNRRTSPLNVQK